MTETMTETRPRSSSGISNDDLHSLIRTGRALGEWATLNWVCEVLDLYGRDRGRRMIDVRRRLSDEAFKSIGNGSRVRPVIAPDAEDTMLEQGRERDFQNPDDPADERVGEE